MNKGRSIASSFAILLSFLMSAAPIASAQSSGKQSAAPDDERYIHLKIPRPNRAAHTSQTQGQPERDNANARHLWLTQRMAGLGGPEYVRHVLREADKQRALNLGAGNAATPAKPASNWLSVGPTKDNFIQNFYTLEENDSGRARTILVHPKNPDIVYFLTSGGGLWKTSNFSSPHPQWTATTDNLLTTSGGSVALGSNPDTIYLGLGDPFDSPNLVAGVMVKSTDGGNTWQPFVGLNANTIRDVKVDTSGPQDIVLVAADGGLFRSTDGGNSYNQVAGANPGDAFFGQELWSVVKTSAGWLASAQTLAFFGSGFFGLNGSGGIDGSLWLSTDQGATWNAIPNAGNTFTGAGRTTLAVAKAGDSVVYAFAADTFDQTQLDLFRSVDGGQNWTALGLAAKTPVNPNPDQPDLNVMHGQAFYNQMILVDSNDENRNTVYLGGNLSTVKSTDGGNTWTVITNWLAQFGLPYVHADCHAAALIRKGKQGTLLFGSDGGLFASTDGGAHWNSRKQEGIQTSLIYTLIGNPQTPSTTLIGLQDDGTRVRVGNTSIFNQTLGGDGFGTGWSQANNHSSLASFQFENIFYSTVNPPSDQNDWNQSSGLDPADANFATPIDTPAATADPSGLVFYTSSFSKIFKSTDGGVNFNLIGQQGVNFGHFPRAVLHTVGISPVDLNHLGVPGTGGNLIITTDGAATWTEYPLNSLVPGYASFNAGVAWANDNLLYAHSEAPIPGVIHVVKGVADGHGGYTFSAPANIGLPDVPVDKLQVDPRDSSGSTLYAATWIGVYRSTDGGNSWSQLGKGLPAVVVSDLYENGNTLRVSTYGRGVWEINIAR